ncbi:hypothetical protein D3C77_702330 [compost metagenome]
MVEVGAGVDHALLVHAHTGAFAFQFVEAFLDVQLVQRALGAGHGVGVAGAHGAGLLDGAGDGAVEGVGLRGGLRGAGLGGGGGFFRLVEFVPAQHEVCS